MLAAISELPEDELHAALKRLVEAELLYQAGLPPKATYRFKHALVQEMAYNSLLKKRRRRLHAAIAAYLTDRNPHLAVVEPALDRKSGVAGKRVEVLVDYGGRRYLKPKKKT